MSFPSISSVADHDNCPIQRPCQPTMIWPSLTMDSLLTLTKRFGGFYWRQYPPLDSVAFVFALAYIISVISLTAVFYKVPKRISPQQSPGWYVPSRIDALLFNWRKVLYIDKVKKLLIRCYSSAIKKKGGNSIAREK